MDLAIIYREVDASKYFLIANLGVEVRCFINKHRLVAIASSISIGRLASLHQ